MRALKPEEMDLVAGGDGTTITVTGTRTNTDTGGISDWAWLELFGNGGTGGGGTGAGYGGGGSGATSETPSIGDIGSDADIWLKDGADIDNFSDEMEDSLDEVVTAERLDLPHVVITAGSNGAHSAGSLHYSGNALDLRANNITDAQAQTWADDLQSALGSDYDVVFEHFASDPRNDHVHVEYDPD
jgi:hypothetical protein